MKNNLKTIARINRDTFNHLIIYFQRVNEFTVVRNENIQYLNIDDRKGYSDWINCGDLIKCEFNHDSNSGFYFNTYYRNNIDFSIDQDKYSSYQLDNLKKDISQFQRIEKLIYKDLDYIDQYLSNVDIKILINILFKRFNVIGGTLDDGSFKSVYNGCNKSSFIDYIDQAIITSNQTKVA